MIEGVNKTQTYTSYNQSNSRVISVVDEDRKMVLYDSHGKPLTWKSKRHKLGFQHPNTRR